MMLPVDNHSPVDELNSSKSLNPGREKLSSCRRKTRKQASISAGVRLRKYRHVHGRRSGVATPFLRWKLDDGRDISAEEENVPVNRRRACPRLGNDSAEVSFSSRKLAFELWQLNLAGDRGSKCGSSEGLRFQHRSRHANIKFQHHQNSREQSAETKDLSRSPLSVSAPKNEQLYGVNFPSPYPDSAIEGATKRDPMHPKAADEVYRLYNRMTLLEDQQIASASIFSALRAELKHAQTHIHELEAERETGKQKLENFLRKLGEERASWRSREHEKIHAVMDDLKSELRRERKLRYKMEILNSKMVNELANAKLSAKKFMQDYEKERKAREILEEVCNELSMEIGEDHAEIEALKKETGKIREEVEEERKMLQMAEVWREERVQMKLVDAKLTLEDKYCQMNKLIGNIEAFLRSKGDSTDVTEMKKAMSTVKIHDVKEFSYVPPKSDDIFSIIKDLQNVDAKEMQAGPCLNQNSMQTHVNGYTDHNRCLEDDASDWETVSPAEDQGSSYSPEGMNQMSFHHIKKRLVHSSNSSNSEKSEICSISGKQSKKKGSLISKLLRSCPSSNGEICKIIAVEGNRGPSNGTISNAETSFSDRGSSVDGKTHPDFVDQLNSPDSRTLHITQKSNLKAGHLEAKDSHKFELRHVLKRRS